MKKMFSIHGVWELPGLLAEFRLTAMPIREAVKHAMYCGFVEEGKTENIFYGHMHDKWGKSRIIDFKINDSTLMFTKIYGEQEPLYYDFTEKKGNVWIGTYNDKRGGKKGNSKCIITEIDESFLDFGEYTEPPGKPPFTIK